MPVSEERRAEGGPQTWEVLEAIEEGQAPAEPLGLPPDPAYLLDEEELSCHRHGQGLTATGSEADRPTRTQRTLAGAQCRRLEGQLGHTAAEGMCEQCPARKSKHIHLTRSGCPDCSSARLSAILLYP